MKTKKLSQKLKINKQTVVNIGNETMNKVNGGGTFDLTVCFTICLTNCPDCYTFATVKCTEPCCETRP